MEDIPWDDIAKQAKEYGISMKEAASNINWGDMGKKLEKLGDKLEDMAEKAHAKASSWFCCCDAVDRENEVTLSPVQSLEENAKAK